MIQVYHSTNPGQDLAEQVQQIDRCKGSRKAGAQAEKLVHVGLDYKWSDSSRRN